MHENRLKTRLGKRLTALFNSINPKSEIIYDLCCDHGALGRACLESNPDSLVVFNDVHTDIMNRLQSQLDAFDARNYSMQVGSASDITLKTTNVGTVMLAGVGDELCIKILSALFGQPQAQNYEFIISPATKTFEVRNYLSQQPVSLVSEITVTENKRTYEIITVKLVGQASKKVDKFGHCWNQNDAEHFRHLKKLIGFYEARLNAFQASEPNAELQSIIGGYKSILEKIK